MHYFNIHFIMCECEFDAEEKKPFERDRDDVLYAILSLRNDFCSLALFSFFSLCKYV